MGLSKKTGQATVPDAQAPAEATAPANDAPRKRESVKLVWNTKPKKAPNPRDLEFQPAEVVYPNKAAEGGQELLFPRTAQGEVDDTKMNRLIWGDNLITMQALLAQGYAGKIQLIYIDPPFLTTSGTTPHNCENMKRFFLLLLFLTPALAGCANESLPPTTTTTPIQDCTGPVTPGLICSETEGRMQLSGAVHAADGEVALRLFASGAGRVRSYVLTNLTVDGFADGIRVTHVLGCECSIFLENVTLKGTLSPASVAYHQVTLAGNQGILDEHLPLSFRNVRIEGYSTAIALKSSATTLSIDNLSIACVKQGLWLGQDSLVASRVVITGCEETAIDLGASPAATITNSFFANNALAIWHRVGDLSAMAVGTSNFTHNGLGILTGLASRALELPPCIGQPAAVVTNSTFYDNGGPWTWLQSMRFPPGAVMAGPFGIRIQESEFLGNGMGVGLVDSNGQATQTPNCLADARYNWWGSSLGPWRGTNGTAPGRPSFGDAIHPGLRVDPFLTQPP